MPRLSERAASRASASSDSDRVDEARDLLETALEGELNTTALFLARLYVEGVGGHPVDPVYGRPGGGPIGPEETLVFELELLAIEAAPEPVEAGSGRAAVSGVLVTAASDGPGAGSAVRAAVAQNSSKANPVRAARVCRTEVVVFDVIGYAVHASVQSSGQARSPLRRGGAHR